MKLIFTFFEIFAEIHSHLPDPLRFICRNALADTRQRGTPRVTNNWKQWLRDCRHGDDRAWLGLNLPGESRCVM